MEKRQWNVLLIDDEPVALEESRQKIAQYVEPSRIQVASNGVQVMEVLGRTSIDLAFIDVEMSDTDGFTIADYIAKTQPKAKYVFLTGHAELGARSYDYEPLDFLCKPLDILRLEKTMERYARSRASRGSAREQIALESTAGFMLIAPADMRYIVRENRKAKLYCKDGSYVLNSALDELELILGEYGLFRCHQSYLVALSCITGIQKSEFGKTYLAILADGTKVPVSRQRYGALKQRLLQDGVPFL